MIRIFKTWPFVAVMSMNALFVLWLITNQDVLYKFHNSISFNLSITAIISLLFAIVFLIAVSYQVSSQHSTEKLQAISIIIPTYNEEKHIFRVLKQIELLDYPKELLKLIIVNDGSKDQSLQEINRFIAEYNKDVHLINFEVNRGKKEGLIEAFKFVNSELLLLLDSDTYLKRDALKKLVQHFDAETSAVCGYTDVKNASQNLITRIQQYEYFISHHLFKAFEAFYSGVMCCPGCFSAFRKEAINEVLDDFKASKIYGYPVDYAEDRYLTSLLIRAKKKIKFAKSAQAWTVVPVNLSSFIVQRKRWIKSWFMNSLFLIRKIHHLSLIYIFYFYVSLIFNLLVISIPPMILYFMSTHQYEYIIHTSYIIILYSIFSTWKEKKLTVFMPILFFFFTLFIYSWLVPLAVFGVKDNSWGRRAH